MEVYSKRIEDMVKRHHNNESIQHMVELVSGYHRFNLIPISDDMSFRNLEKLAVLNDGIVWCDDSQAASLLKEEKVKRYIFHQTGCSYVYTASEKVEE